MSKLFSLVVGCYGDYPQYSIRCVNSLLAQDNVANYCDIHVACCACCDATLDAMWELYRGGCLTSLITTQDNINKDPMMRILLERCRTPYMVWFDDDSHVLPGFVNKIQQFTLSNHPFDAAGKVYFINGSKALLEHMRRRPWWVEPATPRDPKKRITFPTGGLWMARCDFLREKDFPDRDMVKKGDDVIFGELLTQQGKLVGWPKGILDLIKISDGGRRGSGETPNLWEV